MSKYPYRRILLVVDLTEDSLQIGRRARDLAATVGAELELLHVVEFMPVEPMGETIMPAVHIEEELLVRARQRLTALRRNCSCQAPCNAWSPETSKRRS